MNIGIDIRCLMSKNRTGVGEYTYELLNSLFEIDKENKYFLFYNSFKDVDDVIPKWRQENVKYIITRWPNKLFNLCQLMLKWPKLDKKVGCASKLDYWFSPNLNFTALSRRIKFILTIHDLSFEFLPVCFSWKQRLWHRILNPKKQCRQANLIFTPSKNTMRDVVEYYGIDKTKVIPVYPGLVKDSKFQSPEFIDIVKRKYNLPEKFILYLGTLEPRKNISAIIKSFANSSKLQNINHELIIAGARGWKDKKNLEEISNTRNVRYIGYVDWRDKAALYRAADLFIYPSLYEGFGFPVLEAMASGTPVITSNRSSLPEVSGDAAYLINPYNLSEMEKAMEILLRKERLRDILKTKGLEKSQDFNWQKTAHRFLELISS